LGGGKNVSTVGLHPTAKFNCRYAAKTTEAYFFITTLVTTSVFDSHFFSYQPIFAWTVFNEPVRMERKFVIGMQSKLAGRFAIGRQ